VPCGHRIAGGKDGIRGGGEQVLHGKSPTVLGEIPFRDEFRRDGNAPRVKRLDIACFAIQAHHSILRPGDVAMRWRPSRSRWVTMACAPAWLSTST
jgi:hypothetical protein